MESSGLLQAEVLAVVQLAVLPVLTARDLARLSATCRELRSVIARQGPRLWQAASAGTLPVTHPTLLSSTASVQRVQAALSDQAAIHRNVQQGCWSLAYSIPGGIGLHWAPDGQKLAFRTLHPQGDWNLKIRGEGRDAQLLASLAWDPQCQLHWTHDSGGLVVVPGMTDSCSVLKLTYSLPGGANSSAQYELPPLPTPPPGLRRTRRKPTNYLSLSRHGTYLAAATPHADWDVTGRMHLTVQAQPGEVSLNTSMSNRFNLMWHPLREELLAVVELVAGQHGSRLRIVDLERRQDHILHSVRLHALGCPLLAWAGAAALLAYRAPPADRLDCVAIEVVCTLSGRLRHRVCFDAGTDVQCSMSHRGALACMTSSTLQVWTGATEQAGSASLSLDPGRAWDRRLEWSPDCRLLCVADQWDLHLYDGRSCTSLLRVPVGGQRCCRICWSCTGGAILFVRKERDGQHCPGLANYQLCKLDLLQV